MSLNIHPSCAERLIESLEASLSRILIQHNMFLVSDSTEELAKSDAVLPRQVAATLSDIISETPAYDFVYQTLSMELGAQSYAPDPAPTALTALAPYADTHAVAQRVVASFTSLPWRYAFTIPLPKDIAQQLATSGADSDLSDNVRLVVPDDGFDGSFPLTRPADTSGTLLNLLALSQARGGRHNWDNGIAHVQMFVDGFMGIYSRTATADRVFGIFKAFLGAAIAVRLFRMNRSFRSERSSRSFYVHRNVAGQWQQEKSLELDSPVSEAYVDLVCDDLDGQVSSVQDRKDWTAHCLHRISRMFREDEVCNRIRLAAQWLFDSYATSDDLLAFIQSTVAMEILLGDKKTSDIIGIGQLLRNRCAYLISNTHKERELILRDFDSIYDVRSKIVHTGKNRLNNNERRLLFSLRWLCQRVLRVELDKLPSATPPPLGTPLRTALPPSVPPIEPVR